VCSQSIAQLLPGKALHTRRVTAHLLSILLDGNSIQLPGAKIVLVMDKKLLIRYMLELQFILALTPASADATDIPTT